MCVIMQIQLLHHEGLRTSRIFRTLSPASVDVQAEHKRCAPRRTLQYLHQHWRDPDYLPHKRALKNLYLHLYLYWYLHLYLHPSHMDVWTYGHNNLAAGCAAEQQLCRAGIRLLPHRDLQSLLDRAVRHPR